MAQALRSLLLPQGPVPGVSSQQLSELKKELLLSHLKHTSRLDTMPWTQSYGGDPLCRTQTSEHWQWGTLSGPPSKETIDRLTSPTVSRGHAVMQLDVHIL